MKKAFTLLLAAALLLALFAGCGSSPASTTPTATPAQNSAPPAEQTNPPAEPTESAGDEVFYHYAAGNYETDANGFPTQLYAYELPLTNSNEVLTYYTSCMYPQYIPEAGYESIQIVADEEQMTGVNIEYIIANYDTWADNYAIQLVSDDLADIVSKPFDIVTSMMPEQFFTDGYLVNLYPYREYLPNYMYYTNYFGRTMGDTNVYNTVFPADETIYGVYSFFDDDYDQFGTVIRGDWLEQVGVDYTSIDTVDDLTAVWDLFLTQIDDCVAPWLMTAAGDSTTFFGCFETETMLQYWVLPDGIVRDGVVTMPYYNEEDFVWLSTLNDWYNRGYIEPGWAGYLWPQSYEHIYAQGTIGFTSMQTSEVASYEAFCQDPDCTYVPLRQVVREPGQQIHLDYGATYLHNAHTCISTHCENIPLALTWMDWRYSDEGSFFYSYGPQGQTWDYNDEGEIELTEFSTNNPDGMPLSYVYNFYMGNFLLGHGIEIFARRYAFPGGDRYYSYFDYWASTNSDGAWNWPSGLTFSTEQNDELSIYSADVVTFLAENLAAFVDGSRSLATWDDFTSSLLSLGWKEIEAVYQEAYDDFIAERA